MNVIVRPFKKETDAGFIYATFAKGIYFGSKRHKEPLIDFTKEISPKLNHLLDHGQIYIACTDDDHHFFLGYLLANKNTLEWVFVKPGYRKCGVAKLLFKAAKIKDFNGEFITKIGQSILNNRERKKNLNEDRQTTEIN